MAIPETATRVLIVEDEALIAEELRDRLERMGLEVVGVVDSGETAIDTATRTQPDLVLMDIQIKGPRDGIDTARELRNELQLPVVYLTAHSDDATLKRAKETGPFGYVLKPFQERELLVTIEMATHMHTLEKRLRERTHELETTVDELRSALDEIETLRGLLRICAYCERIENDRGEWQRLDIYLNDRAGTTFTHGMCPECYATERERNLPGSVRR